MKLVQIVFSPTGGTQKIADIITEMWDGTVMRIDLSNADTDYSKIKCGQEDVVLAAVPSYGGRVPKPAAERLMKINGGQARCIIVCVYGNRAYEDTLVELQDIMEHGSFRIIAAISAVAEHSIMHQYAAGRPDENDKRQLQEFAEMIFKKRIHQEPAAAMPKIPGNRPYKKAGGAGLIPKAGKDCVNCGLCAKNCPVQAIDKDDLKKADAGKCISCMRCVIRCPKSARKVNSMMVSAAALAMKKACSERKENELF